MRKVIALIVFALGASALASAARAEPSSTFFIGEAWGGYSFGGAFPESPSGPTGGLTLGFGGKPRGLPLRFYGIANLGFSRLDATRSQAFDHATIARDVVAWSFGLRTLAPIVGKLRLFADLTLGGFHVASQAILDEGAERLDSHDGSFLISMGIGLQYRPLVHLSLGARAEYAMPTGLETFDPLAEVAGFRSENAGAGNFNVLVTATLHL